jgi:MobA/MobL family.
MFIAIYHLSIKIISRGKGRSAVAAAAYRSGTKMQSEYDGIIHNYTKKVGIEHTEIMLPNHAPREYYDRSVLWNAVEKVEKNINSQLAREIELALPAELSAEQNLLLVREYVSSNFVSAGMCADICIHDKNDGNPHAHIMLTMRQIQHNGNWGGKQKKEYILNDFGEKIYDKTKRQYKCKSVPATDWNDQSKAEEWRSSWTDIVNRFLEQNNHAERIDHRSYERQGVEQIPTVHMGTAATQMEKRGIRTERGNINREIAVSNSEIRQLNARIRKAKNWLYTQPKATEFMLMDMMNGIAKVKNLETHWKKLSHLKMYAKVVCFLQSNDITDVSQLAEKTTQMYERIYEMSKNIQAIDRRLGTLEQHFDQYEIAQKYKGVYAKYKQLDPKKRDDFYDKHSEEIQLYENANQYFKVVMNGKTPIPIKKWRAEKSQLTDKKFSLCDEFYMLKDETRNVEILRKSIENLIDEIQPNIVQIDKNIRDEI